MLRAVLLIVALVVLLVIGAVWLNVIDLNQTQAPRFEVKVNPVEVGTTTKNVQVEVPRVSVGGGEPSNQQ
jgi:Flp pilus assembly protein CpaB